MVSTTSWLQNKVENNKKNCKIFFAIEKCFLQTENQKINKCKSIMNSNWKIFWHVNTTSIASLTILVVNYLITYSCMMSPKYSVVILTTFQLCEVECLTNDVLTFGTPKTIHHWSAIVEIKSKGKLCCKYDGQCIWPMVRWQVWWFNRIWDEPIIKWHVA